MREPLSFCEVKAPALRDGRPGRARARPHPGHRNGRPSFVLVSPDDLASLEESLDILQDDKLMQSLQASRRQSAAEDTVPLRDQHRNGLLFDVEITREGLPHLKQLPDKVRDAAIQAILGPIAKRPPRVDTPLVGQLTRLYSVRHGEYRVIYEIDDDRKVVIMHPVQHRRVVYRPS